MNRILLPLLFCSLLNLSWAGDTIVSFHQSQIKLPFGFKELSSEELTIFRAMVFDRQIMTVYEKREEPSRLKRIIIYYDSLTGTKNLLFDKIVEIKLKTIKESGITFNDVEIDSQNQYVYGETIIQGDTSLFGFSVDGFGIMGVQFDNSNGVNRLDQKRFAELLNSIKHRSPYEFIPEENSEVEKANKEIENSGKLLIIAFIAVILIWLIRKYVIKK